MPQPLPSPYLPKAGSLIQAARMGEQDQVARQQRGALQQAGQYAAQGSLGKAQKHLWEQGLMQEAAQFGEMIQSADASRREQGQRLALTLGRMANSIQTPEQFERARDTLGRMGFDMSQYTYEDLPMLQRYTAALAEKAAPVKVGAGDSLVDPSTGRVVYGPSQSGPQAMEAQYGKPPSGYRWTMGQDGQPALEAIQGGPATKLSAEVAGRLAALETAKSEFQKVREYFTGDDYGIGGRVNKVLNRGEAGRMERSIQLAVEAALRAMTGAAAPAEEVRNYMDMFAPSFDDRPETIRDKLDRLESFMQNVEEIINRGRGTGAQRGAVRPQGRPAPLGGSGQQQSQGANPNDPLGLFE